jgi:hypothetical protein
MADNRWTLRNVDADVRHIVRLVCSNTDMLAGEVVNKAVEEWVRRHPEVLIVPPQVDEVALSEAFANLGLLLQQQDELLGQLYRHFGIGTPPAIGAIT